MLPFDPSTILPSSILAVTDFWMARWLTPMWFLGIGVIGGLLLLGLLLGLFYVLSLIGKPLDALRETGVAHIIAGLITLALTSVYGLWVGGFLKSFYQQFPTDEFVLLVLAGAIVFAIFSWSLLFCSSTRFFKELRALLFEGVGFYMLCVLGVLSVLSLAVSPLIDQPRAAFNSLPYLLFLKSGVQTDTYKIPGITGDQEAPFTKIDFRYDPRTLSELVLESDKNLLIGDAPSIADFRIPGSRLESGVETRWNRNMGADKAPVPLAQGAEVYVQNQEFGEATLKIRMGSEPPVRQSVTFVWVAVFVAILGLFFMLMQAIAPKTAAIALATAKSELSQPLPTILMLLVAIAILLLVYIPFNTFGEDIKFLKENGITLILIACTFQAVWSASTSVHDEIEGRTALTLLSKPIHRRSFIIGKMLGIFWVVLFMFLVLGSWELLMTAYKPIYDARESSLEQPDWRVCHQEMWQTIPGLAMAFFQSVVLGAIAVALGTRVSFLANFAICFSIYMLGHLTPTIVASAEGGLPLVEFFSQLISAAVPNLSLFSMEAAIDSDIVVPWSILSSVLVYTVLYFLVATLLGLLLFEDRDLA